MPRHSTVYRTLPLREMTHSDQETDINSYNLNDLQCLVYTAKDRVTRNTALMIIRKVYSTTPEPMMVRR